MAPLWHHLHEANDRSSSDFTHPRPGDPAPCLVPLGGVAPARALACPQPGADPAPRRQRPPGRDPSRPRDVDGVPHRADRGAGHGHLISGPGGQSRDDPAIRLRSRAAAGRPGRGAGRAPGTDAPPPTHDAHPAHSLDRLRRARAGARGDGDRRQPQRRTPAGGGGAAAGHRPRRPSRDAPPGAPSRDAAPPATGARGPLDRSSPSLRPAVDPGGRGEVRQAERVGPKKAPCTPAVRGGSAAGQAAGARIPSCDCPEVFF